MIQTLINQRPLFQDADLGSEQSRSIADEHDVKLAFDRSVDTYGPSAALAHLISLAVNIAITWNIERPIAALLRLNADLLDNFSVRTTSMNQPSEHD